MNLHAWETTPEADIFFMHVNPSWVPIKNLKLDCENNSAFIHSFTSCQERGYNISPFSLIPTVFCKNSCRLFILKFTHSGDWNVIERYDWLNSTLLLLSAVIISAWLWNGEKKNYESVSSSWISLFIFLSRWLNTIRFRFIQFTVKSLNSTSSDAITQFQCGWILFYFFSFFLLYSLLSCLFQAASHLLRDIHLTFKWTNRTGTAPSFIDHQSSMCVDWWKDRRYPHDSQSSKKM